MKNPDFVKITNNSKESMALILNIV